MMPAAHVAGGLISIFKKGIETMKCQQCGQTAWADTLIKGICYSCHEIEAMRVLAEASYGMLNHRQPVQAIESDEQEGFVKGDAGYVMERINRKSSIAYVINFGLEEDSEAAFNPAAGFVEIVPTLDLFEISWNKREGAFRLDRKVRSRKRAKS